MGPSIYPLTSIIFLLNVTPGTFSVEPLLPLPPPPLALPPPSPFLPPSSSPGRHKLHAKFQLDSSALTLQKTQVEEKKSEKTIKAHTGFVGIRGELERM